MAHLSEEVLVIKISKLLPDGVAGTPVMDAANIAALKEVIEQLANSDKTLVEIEQA